MGSEMPLQMGAVVQMLPLLMAMNGGGVPGKNLLCLQLRLLSLSGEITLDWLAATQDFLRKALDHVDDLSDDCGCGSDEAGDEGDW